MRINFFEEYPNKANLAKLKLIRKPATVFIAAPSIRKFKAIRSKYLAIHPNIIFGWWPIIAKSYWISGFANPDDLDRLFEELESETPHKELPVLIDLELPAKKYLLFKNLRHLRSNKRRVLNFVKKAPRYNLKIFTAEYPVSSMRLLRLWRWIGISIPLRLPHVRIPMCYSSMLIAKFGRRTWNKIKRFEGQFAKSHPRRVYFGLGPIATGAAGNETLLTAQELAADLEWATKNGVEEVFIFRLGGLTESNKSFFE